MTRIANKMLSVDTADTTAYDHGLIDPFGCIVQRFIEADASAVVAPNSYIIMGDSHDGVTAGVQHSNCSPHQSDWNTTNNLSTLNIDPALIELEFISRINGNGETDKRVSEANRGSSAINHDSYIVQLRGSTGHAPLTTPPADVYTNGSIPQGVVKVKMYTSFTMQVTKSWLALRSCYVVIHLKVQSYLTLRVLFCPTIRGSAVSMEFLTSSMRLNPLRLVKNGWKLLQVG